MNIPTNLYHLQLFCHVVESGGYTQAAQKLMMTQPAISLQVKNLESKLGTTLFIRKGHKMQLTEAGEMVYKEALLILNLERKLKSSLEELQSGGVGHISVCSNHPVGRYLLPNYIIHLMRKYPRVKISISHDNSDNIYQKVLNGKEDIGFVSGIYDIDESKISMYPIYQDYWSLVGGNQFNWDKPWYDIHEVVKQSPFISLLPQTAPGKIIELILKNSGMTGHHDNVFLKSGDIESIKMAVISQLGIAFLPNLTVKRELDQGELKEIPLKDPGLTLNYYMIVNKGANKLPSHNNFIQFILNQV
jgi:DNA-binding transcriptional LysR family regulator